MSTPAYILLGSNLGDREKNLTKAQTKLEAVSGLEIVASSAIYISEPHQMEGENPSFMNQVIKIEYQYLPNELLNALELVEKNLGRTGKGKKEPRTIDLDILLFGDAIIETDELSIPHRELLNRPFAMVPLLEIDPDIVHPVTKEPIAQFLNEEDANEIILYKEHVARHI
ncbi:MAG: 2-amino-4-hydroxy-6-hydroxymethyldihydropteridine diphosphokinase [bacterium]